MTTAALAGTVLHEPAAPDHALLTSALRIALPGPVSVTRLRRITAGATKQTWLVDVVEHGEAGQLILQILPPSKVESMAGAAQRTLTPEQDTRIMQLALAQGVPVPALVLKLESAHGLGHGQITRFVAGETLAPKILRDARYTQARTRLTAQCAQALADTHRIAPGDATFLPRKSAVHQWQDNRSQVDASGVRHPALEWGLRWIEERLAAHVNLRPVPVHGDFRLGNFIVNDDGLAAVIDWELAHLGDPMQDLAWLCLRTWRFGGPGEVGGFGQRGELYAAYERSSGSAVNEQRVFFWEMACQVRWAVMCLGMGLGAATAREFGSTQGGTSVNRPAVSLEHSLIGRRMEEPLWDMIQLAKTRGDAL